MQVIGILNVKHASRHSYTGNAKIADVATPRTFSVEGAQSHEWAGYSGFSVPPGASRKDMLDSPLCNIPWFTIGVSRLLDTHREVHSRQQHRTQLSASGSMMEPHRPLPCTFVGSLINFPLPPQSVQAELLVDSEVGMFASRIYPIHFCES